MLNQIAKTIAVGGIATVTCITATNGMALGATLTNDWLYISDSFNDSTARSVIGGPTVVGGTAFETYGMALRVDDEADTFSFAISSNMPAEGGIYPQLNSNGHIGWGDFFLNFTGLNFPDANGSLYGIRFSEANGSGAPSLGLYANVATKSVTAMNDGWSTVTSYMNRVKSADGTPQMGAITDHRTYMGESTNNVIASGDRIGDVWGADLSTLDFGSNLAQTGTHTFGFSVSRSLLPEGNFIASLIQECFNDAIAFIGRHEQQPEAVPVPEPSTILGFTSVILFGGLLKRNRGKTSQ